MKVIKESLNEAITPKERIKIYHKIYAKVIDRLDQAFDNFAIELASELPEYDPTWCAEGGSSAEDKKNSVQDSFAVAITDMLLMNLN